MLQRKEPKKTKYDFYSLKSKKIKTKLQNGYSIELMDTWNWGKPHFLKTGNCKNTWTIPIEEQCGPFFMTENKMWAKYATYSTISNISIIENETKT